MGLIHPEITPPSNFHQLPDTTQVATTTEYSNITDLEVMVVDGQACLYASTRYDGTLTSWALDETGMTLLDTAVYRGGLRAGSTGSIMQLEVDGRTALVTGGATLSGALQVHQTTTTGAFLGQETLGSAAVPFASLSHGETLTLGNGNQAIFGGLASGADMGRLVFDSAGELLTVRTLYDRDDTFADTISAISSIEIGQAQFLLTASGTENGITAWNVSNTGNISPISSLGIEDGLWVAAPTAMEIATIDTQTYVILAAAGSSSLSVMSLDRAGALQVTDHVIDSQNSRFGGASALAVVEHQGNIYVIAGGADDGLSVFMLRPDGTLLARGHLADTTRMGLENISAISAISVEDVIDIFVASSQVSGITHLNFATGPPGLTLQATSAGGTLTGSAGLDIITGGAGADRIKGGDGRDILTDGAGADRLTGGAGADTFIFAYDGVTDTITDFVQGVDVIDLSAWPSLRSTAQLTFTARADGISIFYGTDVLIVLSADGLPIDPTSFGPTDLIGGGHVPQNIVPGFAGPAAELPALPDRPEYTPYVYVPAPVDPNPEGELIIRGGNQVDNAPPDTEVTSTGRAMMGTNAGEVLAATYAHPNVYGFGGADIISGSSAVNTLYGGAGNDTVYGRRGDDRIFGAAGADRLYGNNGADKIVGGGE